MALESNVENKNSIKEFENLLKEDFKKRDLKENTLVKAKIVEIGKKFCVLDVNGKSDGVIPVEEFKITKELDSLKVNSEIEVYLERIEGPNGIVISREKAKRMGSWKRMEKAFKDEEEVEGIISNRCKGGMIVNVDSCLCFLPGSQIDSKPLKNYEIDELMNVPLKFLCVKLDKVRGNIVVSRRAVLEKTRNKDLKNILSKIKVGQIVEGTVKSLTDWGAFIDLQGVDSLLHVTDLSYSRVKKPSDLLSVGEKISVKIIKIDEATKRISVGVKQMHPDPYENLEKKIKVGDIVTGQVTKCVEYGAFIRIGEGLEGLCHSSELDWTKKNANPSKVLSPSQEVKVKIIEIDPEKRRISLSYKSTLENPWDKLLKDNPVGSVVKAKVVNITDFGIFLDIENSNLSGLLHYKDISWEEKEEDLKKYKKNDIIKVKIVEIDREKEKIRFGVKQLEKDPFDYFADKKNGEVITVKVQNVLKNGIKVAPVNEEKFQLVIKKNQLAKDGRIDVYSVGNRIDCMIIDLDKNKRKVNLSIKELEIQNEKIAIEKYGKSGSTSGAILGDILGKVFSSKKKPKKTKK
tara:strand:- start:51 stop:1775 length:1725 start_codon:yes stop_codon:yes gene_type:complete